MKLNQKGQSSLEALVASASLAAFISLSLVLLYSGAVYTHLKFSSHEALVCPEYQHANLCYAQFKKSISSFLLFGKIDSLQFSQNPSLRKMNLKISLDPLFIEKINFHYRDQVSLPLNPKASPAF